MSQTAGMAGLNLTHRSAGLAPIQSKCTVVALRGRPASICAAYPLSCPQEFFGAAEQ